MPLGQNCLKPSQLVLVRIELAIDKHSTSNKYDFVMVNIF